MASLKELQRIDWELFSELTESPINPAFLHMSTPLFGKYDPMFYLQINGQALWELRELSGKPDKVFEALQHNLPKIGYRLSSSSSARIGMAVSSRIGFMVKKIRNISNGNKRRAVRSGFWCRVAIHPEEISQGPQEVIKELQEQEERLIGENRTLNQEMEGKAAELYNAMMELRNIQRQEGHQGKTIEEVGLRQQQRHLREIRDKALKGLWFAETYGLTLTSLHMEDKTGRPFFEMLISDLCFVPYPIKVRTPCVYSTLSFPLWDTCTLFHPLSGDSRH